MNTGQPTQGQANAGQEDYLDKGLSLHAFCASWVLELSSFACFSSARYISPIDSIALGSCYVYSSLLISSPLSIIVPTRSTFLPCNHEPSYPSSALESNPFPSSNLTLLTYYQLNLRTMLTLHIYRPRRCREEVRPRQSGPSETAWHEREDYGWRKGNV